MKNLYFLPSSTLYVSLDWVWNFLTEQALMSYQLCPNSVDYTCKDVSLPLTTIKKKSMLRVRFLGRCLRVPGEDYIVLIVIFCPSQLSSCLYIASNAKRMLCPVLKSLNQWCGAGAVFFRIFWAAQTQTVILRVSFRQGEDILNETEVSSYFPI